MNNFYNEPAAIQALSRLGTTIPWPAFPICMSAVLAVKLGNGYGVSNLAIPIANDLLGRLTKNQWDYYLNECLPGDELVLQKLSWYERPQANWLSMVKEFQLPTKADKSPQVTKLLLASQKAGGSAAIGAAAKVLLDSMQK